MEKNQTNNVTSEKYWNSYTIADANGEQDQYLTKIKDSINHFKTIDNLYPCYNSLFGLFKKHKNKTILDYGCGPANDLLGFALFSECKKIIGVDISDRALKLARQRLKLHKITVNNINDENGVTLLKITEKNSRINIPDDYVDYVQSTGVIHHTPNPVEILKEIFRILKPGGKFKIMMYHRNSIYVRLILVLELLKKNMNIDVYYYFEKMGRADSGAPIAFLSDKDDFLLMGKKANFDCKFINAAFSIADLQGCLDIPHVLYNKKFPEKHKNFLRDITYYTVKEIEMENDMSLCDNKNNILLEIDRLYEVEITVNNLYLHLPLNYTFDGLTDKGYYDNNCNFNLIVTSGKFTIKKKLYSFKDKISITEINKNFENCQIKIRKIYPLYNGYHPGMNAIYEFIK